MLKTLSGRRASQNESELGGFIALLQAQSVRSYCEIGARHGDTFVAVMESLPVGSRGIAVDLPGGLWGKDSTRPALERAVVHLIDKGYDVSWLFGDSTTPATRAQIVGRGPYDAILIDGDHTYAGVTKDWELYGRMARLVAFHDIVGTGEIEKVHGNVVEVPRLWAEIRATGKRVSEFIDEGSRMGIGVAWTA